MKYTTIYADEEGETHFKDTEIELEPRLFAPPAPPFNLSTFYPATQYAFGMFPSGWHGDWHPPPRRLLYFVLSGEAEVEASDGEVRRFNPGSILLVEDVSSKGHVSRVLGSEDMTVVVIQLPD
jgi:hypothetical protein